MKLCSYCGRENDDARPACRECGTELSAVCPSVVVESRSWRWRAKFGMALATAAFILLFILAVTQPLPGRLDTIEIRGTTEFKDQVMSALILLRTRSPVAYGIVTNQIGRIKQAKHSGMAAYETPPRFQLSRVSAFYSVTWCAISIAHDSLHSKRYHDYLAQHPGDSRVPDDVWTGEQAEKRCCEHQWRVAQEIGAPASEIAWSAWDPTNRYWEIPYNKVYW
jgi:hypothetical protein